jgi:membrane protease YdiL (CAAX protease family)
MSPTAAIDVAVYAAAIAFGTFAILPWRRRGAPIAAGLGLALDRRPVLDVLAGIAIAIAAMVGIFVAEFRLGGIYVTHIAFDSKAALIIGLFLAAIALIDEITMRGMLVSGLSLALGGRPFLAVLIGGVLFGLTHMFFDGASALSVIGNSLGGVVYGLAFVLTGRIWLGVGLHFAWNFIQGPILGFTVSGHALGGGLFRIIDLGPEWLTGTPYGPEGGVIGVAFRVVIIGLLLGWVRVAHRPGTSRFDAGNRA